MGGRSGELAAQVGGVEAAAKAGFVGRGTRENTARSQAVKRFRVGTGLPGKHIEYDC